EDNLDIRRAEEILNQNHYGLQPIKARILEHLAVKKMRLDRKHRVLVVDDEEIARKNIAHILIKENYAVQTASNGMEALAKLETADFDVILTDLKMPKIDGMEILEGSKARYPNTEVIMITGYATIDTAVEAMKKGAFHYIAKPFNLDDVRSIVAKAVEKKSLVKETKGSVLCFSGPPGTGKTSLGRSIAYALGRKFGRISLGGIKDEAEIRGHRRTYAGAMPGRIIEEIRRTESLNPVIILDEVDKIGNDLKGDPASALLEALDPEQNSVFMDHYLDIPFDLSGVLFIITANVGDNILGPLRDRMEMIQFSGYTEEEKTNIALQFLIPRQIREAGLPDYPPRFTKEAVSRIIQEYTYEAGIRNLNREIGSICRRITKDFVNDDRKRESVTITPDNVSSFLGPRKYHVEVAEGKDRVGITTGLVWTEVGGDIISVEAVKMRGKQKLILTGSLGSVMQESAQAALSYVRSNVSSFGIPEGFFEDHDIHVHVPAGAIPKDGPSAGTTIALALISLLTGKPARWDVAVTGELTLSGRILPVGGIKEKLLAARRARIKTIILPAKNRVDMESIPEDAKRDLNIVFAENIEEIIDLAMVK
ncbi:MAG: endopeptidase La, partial [bacterium]